MCVCVCVCECVCVYACVCASARARVSERINIRARVHIRIMNLYIRSTRRTPHPLHQHRIIRRRQHHPQEQIAEYGGCKWYISHDKLGDVDVCDGL